MKFKITKLEKECFFLKLGAIVVVDYYKERVYSEDMKQYIPLEVAFKLGIDGEQLKGGVE